MNESLNLAQKCTGCAHLLDSGEWSVPRCVDQCPTEAIKFGEEADLADLIAKAEVLQPETGNGPRVYYLNMPKKFIGGTVYDPAAEEIIEGAKFTLKPAGGGAALTTQSDDFGDFWFEGLQVGVWDLDIEAAGYAKKSFTGLNTEVDINLGDIAL
jgi:ferredoxin